MDLDGRARKKGHVTKVSITIPKCQFPPCINIILTYNVYKNGSHIYAKWVAKAHGCGVGRFNLTFPVFCILAYQKWHIQPKWKSVYNEIREKTSGLGKKFCWNF